MSDSTTPVPAAAVPPVKADASKRTAPVATPAKGQTKARVWFKDPKTGASKLRG